MLQSIERKQKDFPLLYLEKLCSASLIHFFFHPPGNPKGAMLTHGNVVADFSGFLKVTEVNILYFLANIGCRIFHMRYSN